MSTASEMILLGAGASVEAGVPDAYAMTKAIADQFRKDHPYERYAHVISFVIGGLLFEAGRNGEDPLAPNVVNVEDLFNAVQLLADRHTLEAAPFVGSWHAMVEEFDKIRPSRLRRRTLGEAIYRLVSKEIKDALSETPSPFESRKIDDALANTIRKTIEAAIKNRSPSLSSSDSTGRAVEHYVRETAKRWSQRLSRASPSDSGALDREISELVDGRQPRPGGGRIFHQTNEQMIAELKSMVWIDEAKSVQHLGPIINLLRQQRRLVIATLNYDNGIELLAGSQGVGCETGIEQWSNTGDFDFSGEELFLLKLHGSIDWIWSRNVQQPDRLMPHSVIRRVTREGMMKAGRPAVIFGQRNKLTAEGPFLDLLRAFREELSRSRTLTVVGYSFRDPHINVYISQWLNASRDHTIRIINGADFETQPIDYVRALVSLRGKSPEQVKVIPQYAGSGLIELYGAYHGSFETTTTAGPDVEVSTIADG